MSTPDASQYTQFKRYASVSGDALGSAGFKINPFNTAYSIPMLTARTQALFLPSSNKEKKFPPSGPSIPGPYWVRELGTPQFLYDVYVNGVATDPNDGTVIVCGQTYQVLFNGNVGDTYNGSVAFIARYTPSGSLISGTNIGSGVTYTSANAITTDVHGNIYICGTTHEDLTNPSTTYDSDKGFYAKFSSSLELAWVFELGSGWQRTYSSTIMVSPDGYLYVGGSTVDTDWYIDSPHASFNYYVGYTVQFDATTGEQLSGRSYGSGNYGGVYVTAFTYVPVGVESFPIIAVAGYSYEDLDLNGGVSHPGDGGIYGFISFNGFDLAPGPIYGLGSGQHNTYFSCMTLVTTQCGVFIWVGGDTNEYLEGPNQDLLLEGGGYQGFVIPFVFGPGFIYPSLIGDERNYTAVTAISSDNYKFYVGGITNENLTNGDAYNGMVLVNFTLQTDFASGFTDIRQIGTGTSFQLLTGMESDTFGNFYAGGVTSEHLPNGPSINGNISYVAKIADQPKTYNTPIFLVENLYTSSNQYGYVRLEYTAPITIDWGDGMIDTITNGFSDGFSHTYADIGIYRIVVDVGTGGEITLFRASGCGIETLDVSRCPSLTYLRCDNNSIRNLDVSGCPNLTYLRCDGNYLVSIDVSGLSQLNYLFFAGNNNAISTIHYEGCGLTDGTDITLENSILDLSNNNSYPGRIYMYAKQQDDYFEGNAADYFSGPLPDWTFVILPNPPVTVTADLSGLTFDGSGSLGHNYTHLLTFPSTTTLIVKLSHTNASINQVTHLQFQGPDGTLTTSDTYTVQNPTLSPSVSTQDVGGTVYLYTNGSFPLTASSTITLVTANPITSVTFNMF